MDGVKAQESIALSNKLEHGGGKAGSNVEVYRWRTSSQYQSGDASEVKIRQGLRWEKH
jgi:hypothetical protein